MTKITNAVLFLSIFTVISLWKPVNVDKNNESLETITATYDEKLGVIMYNGRVFSEKPQPPTNWVEEEDEIEIIPTISSKKPMVKNNKLIEHNLKLQNHLKIRGFGKHKNAGVLNSLLKYYAKLKKLILDPIDDLFEIPEFWLAIAGIFIVLAALMSGLTASYLSMNWADLKFKILNGTKEEQEMAAEVLDVVKDRHSLIVTLLFTNELLMELIWYCFEELVPGLFTLFLTIFTTLVLEEFVPKVFLRVFPKLRATALLAPFVKSLRFFLCILVYPSTLFLTLLLKSLNFGTKPGDARSTKNPFSKFSRSCTCNCAKSSIKIKSSCSDYGSDSTEEQIVPKFIRTKKHKYFEAYDSEYDSSCNNSPSHPMLFKVPKARQREMNGKCH